MSEQEVMAFSMKLKHSKKSTKSLPANTLQTQNQMFSVEDLSPTTSKTPSRLPPPPVAMPSSSTRILSKAERAVQEALNSDPNAFDYDGIYDTITEERQKQKEAKKVKGVPQSKYIATLIEKAKIREIEHDRIREKRLLKERAEDDAIHGDKEKFITSSYKRKLMESKRWEEEDARLAKLEEAQDVTKRGEHGMAGFYANLLTKNIAMGGDVANATSAYTTGLLNQRNTQSDVPVSPKRRKVLNEDLSANAPATEGGTKQEDDHKKDADVSNVSETITSLQAPETKSREVLIREAKARYMARKQQP